MLQDSKPKFLIVDDEPIFVELVTAMVSPCAYEFRKAYDGEEAVSVAKQFRPDCVVTGVIMPRMGGFQEAIAILEFLPTCKFVFLSGSADNPAVLRDYEHLGPNIGPLLAKPFKRTDLLNALALAGFPCAGDQ